MKDKVTRMEQKGKATGFFCALASMVIWGFLPVYWKNVGFIHPFLIMFYRLVLACILVFVVSLFVYDWSAIWKPLKEKGAIRTFFLAGAVISLNWGTYIFMVSKGMVIQTSIGYYIEPLIICLFGILFFHEKLTSYKVAALIFACAGAVVMIFSYGQFPFMAFVLAFTFAVYGAIKKKVHAPALLSLFYETFLLLPFILPLILYFECTGNGAFSMASGSAQLGLLALSGPLTAIPLCLFSMGANRISLIAIGLIEYVSPSIGLMLGIFLFKEDFDLYQFIGFVIIWIGLAFFTMGSVKEMRAIKE